jgi:hypothetical protein
MRRTILFAFWETTEYQPRAVALEEAMARMAARYPQDDEAQILYAKRAPMRRL